MICSSSSTQNYRELFLSLLFRSCKQSLATSLGNGDVLLFLGSSFIFLSLLLSFSISCLLCGCFLLLIVSDLPVMNPLLCSFSLLLFLSLSCRSCHCRLLASALVGRRPLFR
eukprot:Mycagemm_TRINITY_DN10303_c0_g6::TRINITY_DN10303_c0_g6_i2::g.630::m.630 type:complete len:112 gc:universal TRINITY_DN10303_c0_g6_i2:359-24(-)